ncbi:MAG: hypothetical protein H7A47_01795 [Verrucomicrobiales bacterium]|nr:hypothetical protein [Verrucomicrobiales bacterium]
MLSGFSAGVFGQGYSIERHTVEGGGGTSTGGMYCLASVIGQPVTGTLSSTDYLLHAGFWGGFAGGQGPDAPSLSVVLTAANTVAVTWPSPSPGWTLQRNTNGVSSGDWIEVTSGIGDDGERKFLIVEPSSGPGFYRLLHR